MALVIGIADDEQKVHNEVEKIITQNYRNEEINLKHYNSLVKLKDDLCAKPKEIEILLLDVNFGQGYEQAGIEALPLLTKYSPDLSIILMTAMTDREILSPNIKKYNLLYVNKPSLEGLPVFINMAIDNKNKKKSSEDIPDKETILSRIEKIEKSMAKIPDIEKNIDNISKELKKIILYKDDHETALMYARKSVEAICLDIYKREKKTTGSVKLTLDPLLSQIKNVLPEKIERQIRTIQIQSNPSHHADADVDNADFESVLVLLPVVVSWYLNEYLHLATQ